MDADYASEGRGSMTPYENHTELFYHWRDEVASMAESANLRSS